MDIKTAFNGIICDNFQQTVERFTLYLDISWKMLNWRLYLKHIIVATGILFNIGRRWGDEEPEEDGVDDDEADDVIIQDLSVATVRLRGQVERDRLKDAMPMP